MENWFVSSSHFHPIQEGGGRGNCAYLFCSLLQRSSFQVFRSCCIVSKTNIPETIGKNKIKQINREPIAFLLLTSIKRVRLPSQSAKRQLVQN